MRAAATPLDATAPPPPRQHKMVFVDFSNSYLRRYLAAEYARTHERQLDAVRAALPRWAAAARAEEEATRGAGARPLAAVLDIDEVVLANIHMNEYHAGDDDTPIDFYAADSYRAPGGGAWPRGDARFGPLLPGARALLEALRGEGAAVFFVTGRLESVRAETVANFVAVGLADAPGAPFRAADLAAPSAGADLAAPGRLLMCPDAEYPPPGASIRPFKEGQRRAIDAAYRIVVNVGDQASDLGDYGDVQVHTAHPFYFIP